MRCFDRPILRVIFDIRLGLGEGALVLHTLLCLATAWNRVPRMLETIVASDQSSFVRRTYDHVFVERMTSWVEDA